MTGLYSVGILLFSYVLGSIPFGLLVVRFKTGKDLRSVESGRTGGTNAMRAAGLGAGLLTALLDILKGAGAVWLAETIFPGNHLTHVLAPLAAILGHNYSIFMPEVDEHGKFKRLRGGAGGAPAMGGALGLWPPAILIVLPLGAVVLFTLGIASVATMSVALFAIILFAIRAALGLTPWVDVLYPILAEVLLVWALRPNIRKLVEGNERVIPNSLNGRLRERRAAQHNKKADDRNAT